MGTCGQPGYVFPDFCLKQGIDFIIFCLNQGIDFINFCLKLDCLQSTFSLKIRPDKTKKGKPVYPLPQGGYSIYPWVGRCGPAPHTLTLFKTKIADFRFYALVFSPQAASPHACLGFACSNFAKKNKRLLAV